MNAQSRDPSKVSLAAQRREKRKAVERAANLPGADLEALRKKLLAQFGFTDELVEKAITRLQAIIDDPKTHPEFVLRAIAQIVKIKGLEVSKNAKPLEAKLPRVSVPQFAQPRTKSQQK